VTVRSEFGTFPPPRSAIPYRGDPDLRLPPLLRCANMEPHGYHLWLCPWATPTERWCPGVRETFYYRGRAGGRVFYAMSDCTSPLPDPDPRG